MRSFRSLLPVAISAALLAGPARADEDHLPPRGGAVPDRAQSAAQGDSILYAARVQNGNKVGLTLTNYGFVGTNFSSFAPSFEYPLGSGHMHMVRGGPWIGAISADENGAFIGVSTSTEDGYAGGSRPPVEEFTPAGTYIAARSTLPASIYFDRDAVSELDFISSYSDRPSQPLINHRSMNLIVNQYNFEWSFSNYAHFVIFHYVIHNDGPPLQNVWVGMYDELASGNMRLQSSYPPTGWFSKKLISWVDSLNMVTERYCQARPFPAQCRFDLVPEIAAVTLLGVKPGNIADTSDKKVTFAAWNFAPSGTPGSVARGDDSLKYALMSSGVRMSLNPLPDSLSPVLGDPVELLAVGPFKTINPGDSISADFAYIGGLSYDDLAKRAIVAKRAYDLNYVVPVPPPSPTLRMVSRANAVDYYWDRAPEDFVDPTSPIGKDFEGYRLYVGDSRDSLKLIAQYDLTAPPHDTTGFNTGFSAIAFDTTFADGKHFDYRYRVSNLRDGFKYFGAVTAYDLGNPEIESLESGTSQNEQMVIPGPAPSETAGGVSVFPNPYKVEAAWDRGQQARDHYLWFTRLPSRCSIQIFTLSGDLVFTTDFDGSSYDGSNARGINPSGSGIRAVLSGTTFGWDMITRQGQAIASGLYIWAVKDKDNGKRQTGKILILKSDRESF